MYPPGFATTVSVAGLTEPLEGEHRGRAHFDGVTTVVTKLLNIVGPDVAYFGQKDAQQAVVIRRLVRDLDMPVRIEVCPTVREPDGLAMSSRNVLLSPRPASPRHLASPGAARDPGCGRRRASAIAAAARAQALAELTSAEIELEYLELVSPDTLAPRRSGSTATCWRSSPRGSAPRD